MKPIHVIGLTGQTGAGKSTVCRVFTQSGMDVIDCDAMYHEQLNSNRKLVADLALEFGIMILTEDGGLDRRALGRIVFSDREKLKRLNAIAFPYIREEIRRRVLNLQKLGHSYVVLDAPTLFESGIDADCETVVSVIAPENLRLNRIMVRDHLSDTEARARMSSQYDDAYYTSRSKYVLNNDADEDALKFAALELVGKLFAGDVANA